MATFIENQANAYSASTLKRRLAAIGKIHELLDHDNPTINLDVRLALRRALRSKVSRPDQALGLVSEIRDKLINACNDDLTGRRDKALITIGYDCLCRRSELVAICYEHIEFKNQRIVKILIPRSKNDPMGIGRIAYISTRASNFLKSWLKTSEIKHGPVFRSIKHGHTLESSLHPNSVNRILKKLAIKSGMDKESIKKLSGHSMRIGAAQDMVNAGIDILSIMTVGGWKSINVVARYVENANMEKILRKFHK